MTEAWMKRGSERQKFLEELKRQIMDEEDKFPKGLGFQIPFTISILHNIGEPEGVVFNLYRESPTWTFFYKNILPQIRAFARTPEEASFLITEVLIWTVNSLTSLPRQALSTQETYQPELLFEGHRAMDDVELDKSG